MVKLVAAIGERLLGAVVPKGSADAASGDSWTETKCVDDCTIPLSRSFFSRKCFDAGTGGIRCYAWQKKIDCERLVVC